LLRDGSKDRENPPRPASISLFYLKNQRLRGGAGVSQITLFNNEKIPSIRTSHNISHKMTFGLPRPSAVSEE
jgi:hypothetical protein